MRLNELYGIRSISLQADAFHRVSDEPFPPLAYVGSLILPTHPGRSRRSEETEAVIMESWTVTVAKHCNTYLEF